VLPGRYPPRRFTRTFSTLLPFSLEARIEAVRIRFPLREVVVRADFAAGFASAEIERLFEQNNTEALYIKAKREGTREPLVRQERENRFTLDLGNLQPATGCLCASPPSNRREYKWGIFPIAAAVSPASALPQKRGGL
jgi:hypothetical protein